MDLCVFQRNIQHLLNPAFGLELGSRPSKCLRVWVLVPVLIKEMLFGGEKNKVEKDVDT